MKQETVNKPWRVVILGAGFGGLSAAETLNSGLFEVTLVDRRDYHLYQPLLGQVATASRSPRNISAPLQTLIKKQSNVRLVVGTVQNVDPESKQVLLADGAVLDYDSLIVATGSESSYSGNEQWREWAPSLKSIEDARVINHNILHAFEMADGISNAAQRRAWLTFVIVGGGPTGVELAGAIAEMAKQKLSKPACSIRRGDCQIVLLEGSPRVLMSFPEDLAEKATQSLVKLGVTVRCSTRVTGIDRDGVTIGSAENLDHIEAKTVIWAGGMRASSFGQVLAERTNADTDKAGRVKVRPDLTLQNYPDIYVIGDLADCVDLQGKRVPGVKLAAQQEGKYVAKAILRKVRHQAELPPFQYHDQGSVAVIARGTAVANVSGFHLSGLLAWIVWAGIHLTSLLSFQYRLSSLAASVVQRFTFRRRARVITHTAPSDF